MDTAHIEHGTHAGYEKHLRTGTQPCRPCRTAHAADKRARRSTNELLREVISLLDEAARDAGWY